jgi:WhiB family redox-sensing transcriptional regulator
VTISYAFELADNATDVRAGELMASVDPLSSRSPAGLPCQVRDPDLWFADAPEQLETAKTFCGDCPARLACLAGALQRQEPWGVWGGEIFSRGVVLARKRGRGRPRKSEVVAA